MKFLPISISTVFMLGSIAGCACGPNHAAFVTQQRTILGQHIPIEWLSAKPNENGFLGISHLSNGNKEIGWLHRWGARYRTGECRVYYEFSPKTNIVSRWRFEGSKEDCISVC